MIEAAKAAIEKLKGYYLVHSHHSILAIVLDPCFKLTLFEQQVLDAVADSISETQIQFKDKAIKVLQATFEDYSAKVLVKKKSKNNVTVSKPVSTKTKEKI